MKKLLLTALGVAAFIGANAADNYYVYSNGVLGANLEYSGWWNAELVDLQATDPTNSANKVISFQPAGAGTTNSSWGIYATDVTVTGPLSTATLHFSWYTSGTGTYTIRLTDGPGGDHEFNFDLSEISTSQVQNAWNDASINIGEKLPSLAETWANAAVANNFYVFSMVMSSGSSDDIVYVKDIYYSGLNDAWVQPGAPTYDAPTTVPTPTQSQDDVLSLLSSKYSQAAQYSWEQWGASTTWEPKTIADQTVYFLKNFTYLGWQLSSSIDISGYDYMHVDYWTPNGETFMVTPINTDLGSGSVIEYLWTASSVQKSNWNSYDIPLSYFSEAGIDLTGINQVKFDDQPADGVYGYLANVYFYKGDVSNNPGGDQTGEGNGLTYSGTINGVFGGNPEINGEPLTDLNFTANWTATWNKDQTVTFSVNVEPQVTGISPQLFVGGAYEGTFVEGKYTTKNKYNENANPNFALFIAYAGGSTDQYPFDYIVGSTNSSTTEPGDGGDDNTPEGEGNGLTYYGTIKGTATGVGATDDDKQDINYTAEWNATWNKDMTVTFNLSVNPSLPGMVPQIFVNGAYDGNFSANGTDWTYTTTEKFEKDAQPFGFMIAYTGGATAVMNLDYKVGDSNEPPTGSPETPEPENPGEGNEAVFTGELNGVFTNATFNGITSDYDYVVIWTATWNKDMTVTIELAIDPTVDGLMPQLFVNGEYSHDFETTEGGWTYTTPDKYEMNQKPFSLYMAYAGGFVDVTPFNYAVGSTGTTVGVKGIDADNNAPVEFYNLNGQRINNPENGIFIRRQGNSVSKVVIR